MDNTEELNELTEETLQQTMEALNAAMVIGDYKKCNELLDVLSPKTNQRT